MHSLPTLSSLCPKLEEEDEEVPDEISRLLEHLSRQSRKQKSKLDWTEKHDGLVQLYQERLKQTSNKKVRPSGFQETSC